MPSALVWLTSRSAASYAKPVSRRAALLAAMSAGSAAAPTAASNTVLPVRLPAAS